MLINKKSVIINETVSINVDGIPKPVMALGATLGTEGLSLTITKRIMDKVLYDANLNEMEAKYDEFIIEARNKAQEAWTE